jgi:hypothetical protein
MAQHQDTMFVESDDGLPPTYTRAEAAKIRARKAQQLISNELSRLAADEYLEDIMQYMAHMEVGPGYRKSSQNNFVLTGYRTKRSPM